jgi:hypothetical protein
MPAVAYVVRRPWRDGPPVGKTVELEPTEAAHWEALGCVERVAGADEPRPVDTSGPIEAVVSRLITRLQALEYRVHKLEKGGR